MRGAAPPAPLPASPPVPGKRLRPSRDGGPAARPRFLGEGVAGGSRRAPHFLRRPHAPPPPLAATTEGGHGAAGGRLRGGGAAPPRLRLHQLLLVRAAGGRGRCAGREGGSREALRRMPLPPPLRPP